MYILELPLGVQHSIQVVTSVKMDSLLKSIEAVKHEVVKRNVEVGVNVNRKVKLPFPVLLNSATYPLNKSRSKLVCVGLCCYQSFAPSVVIYGQRGDWVQLEETEWKTLVENKGVISNYLTSKELQPQLQPVNISHVKRICFRMVGPNKVITLQDMCGAEVYLGIESVAECWQLLSLVEYKMRLLKSLEFEKFYTSLIKGVWELPGDFKTNIVNVLRTLDITSDNVLCMQEMLQYGSEIIRCDVEMNQFTQMMAQ